MNLQEFGPIEVDEIKAVRFDFSTETQTPLLDPVVEVSLLVGVDPDPDLVLVGPPAIVGFEVVQKIRPGVVGCEYKLRCVADSSDGLRHALSGKFRVVPG